MLGDRSSYLLSYRFRWVFCQLEVLRHCLPASIRQTLDRLPETLDETYARVLSQIPQANQAHAHRLLQCLMVAIRPLRVEELAEVLAFEFDTAQRAVPRYRADWRPNDQVQAVLSTCSSLIAIVDYHGSQVVQFSHFSVKEFLMSDRLTSSLGDFSRYQINPGSAHTILAQACLGCLLHIGNRIGEESIKDFPLTKYAAQHWVTHAQFENVASRVKDGMESLFDCDKPHFAAWVGIHDIDEFYLSSSTIPTPLYYSSLCGFSDLVQHLAMKRPQDVNAVGGRYDFPLLAALHGKHIQVAEILLKHGAMLIFTFTELENGGQHHSQTLTCCSFYSTMARMSISGGMIIVLHYIWRYITESLRVLGCYLSTRQTSILWISVARPRCTYCWKAAVLAGPIPSRPTALSKPILFPFLHAYYWSMAQT